MSAVSIATVLVAFLTLTYAINLPNTIRLPTNVKPINYNISITPYLNESDPRNFTFDGECFIEIQAAQNANEVQLHLENLNIHFSEYYKKDSPKKTLLPSGQYNHLTHIMVYNLNEVLQAKVSYILHFIYTGFINDNMKGFYRSSYKTSKNETKWAAVTKFESNSARQVFPCFDEPNFKATFDISLTYHNSLRSAGPTRLIETRINGEYVTDVYATTPKMSTYVLGFVIFDLSERSDGQFGVLANPEKYSQTEYGFTLGKKILKAFSDYFGIPYYSMGIDKMQLVAVKDFSQSAQENWGLVVFDEYLLLYDDVSSTRASKQKTALFIAHEIAHMWFGNLVTMDWWNCLWLKEGFAEYFKYFGLHMVESNFAMDQQFITKKHQFVMERDALENAIPLTAPENITNLDRAYNAFSYSKGASFVRVVKHILGEEKFKTSLNEYLKTHQYSNTVPSDLFTIWKKYWPQKFTQYADRFFDSFTTQVGYPVVTFNRTSNTEVEVTQKRFVLKNFDRVDLDLLYTVPITYTTNSENDFQNTSVNFFLERSPVQITVPNDTKWIMGNIQETGYYRVNYDKITWQRIKQSLQAENWDGIHELNRAQIIDDLFNFVKSGDINYSFLFDMLEYLETETSNLPWTVAFSHLSFVSDHLGTDIDDFARYIRFITQKLYNKLGFEGRKGETALDIDNRESVLEWACKFGNTDCISKAKSYFNNNLKENPVPSTIRPLVYCVGMREGNEQDFDKLFNNYKAEKDDNEKELILYSFCCVKNPKLISRVFHILLSEDHDSLFDIFTHLYSKNNENVDPVLDLVTQNFEQLKKRGFSDAMMYYIRSYLTTNTQIKKFYKVVDKYSLFTNGVVLPVSNYEWAQANAVPIKKFLRHWKHL